MPALVVVWLAGGLSAQVAEPRPDGALRREVRIPLHEGRVDLAELGRVLADAYGFDAGELRLPAVRLDLRGVRGYATLRLARELLLDTVHFHRTSDRSTLLVTVDRVRAREVRRGLRTRVVQLVSRLTGGDLLARRYELALPPDLDRSRALAVLVHGVESSPAVWSDLLDFLGHEPGRFQVATFAYPNDEAVERIAAALAAELRALAPQRVAIVGHSMGGLIARAVVEDPVLDPGNVEALLLIGTPSGGSSLAGMRFALEAAHLLQGASGDDAFGQALLAGLRDGLGEAGGDLLPGSVLLTTLARRPRNPRVAYRVVLGTRSLLREAQLEAIRARLTASLGATAGTRAVRPKVERWLASLDELVDGKGDGAVSVARGQIEGVEAVLVPLDHVGLLRLHGLLGRVQCAEEHAVLVLVKEWLAGLP